MARRNKTIRIQETSDSGVVISTLQVVPTCFGVVVITTIAEGVISAESRSESTRSGKQFTPSVIGIFDYDGAHSVNDTYHISLEILQEVIGVIIVMETYNTSRSVVDIVKFVVYFPNYGFFYDFTSVEGIVVDYLSYRTKRATLCYC